MIRLYELVGRVLWIKSMHVFGGFEERHSFHIHLLLSGLWLNFFLWGFGDSSGVQLVKAQQVRIHFPCPYLMPYFSGRCYWR